MAYVQVHLMSVKTKQGDEIKQSQIMNGTIHGYYIHSTPPLLPPPSAVKWLREAKTNLKCSQMGGLHVSETFQSLQVQKHSTVRVSFIWSFWTIYKKA